MARPQRRGGAPRRKMIASSARMPVRTSSGLISSRACSDTPSLRPLLREFEVTPLCALLEVPSVRARTVKRPPGRKIHLYRVHLATKVTYHEGEASHGVRGP